MICRDPGLRRDGGKLNPEISRKVAPGERRRRFQDFVVSSGCNHLAAAFSGARPQIENAVGGPHHVRIVLNYQNRISQVAQVVQNLDQAVSVATMQADRRLVQHIQSSDQARAQRSRQLNALRFAARKRGGQPVQGQIFQAHINQKLQSLVNLLQKFVGDGGFLLRQLDLGEELRDILDRHAGDLADILALRS